MGLNAKKAPMQGGGKKIQEQDAIEPGSYPARVVSIIDLGLQPQRAFQGQEKPPKQEIKITYELLDEFCLDENGEEMEDKPRWISEDIPFNNLDVDLATSTKRYKALDPDMEFDGDFTQLLGLPCIVTVTAREGKGKHQGRVFNNVASIAQMRAKEAKKAPELVNPTKLFICSEPDLEVFRSLPEFQQNKIKENLEYNGSVLQTLLEGGKAENSKQEQSVPVNEGKMDAKPADEDDGEW